MSIARNEAERIYQPATICGGPYDRASRIRAYVRGRAAEPCREQVEAGAIALMASQTNFAAGSNSTENDIIDAWNHLPENMQNMFRMRVESVLEAVRKAVM